MQDITYENFIKKVSEMFPKYLETDSFKYRDFNLPYAFFAGLMEFIVDLINKIEKPEENTEIKVAFDLINYMIDQGDKLENLAVVEGIEGLLQEKKSKELAKNMLNEKGKYWLKEVYKYTGIRDDSKIKKILKSFFIEKRWFRRIGLWATGISSYYVFTYLYDYIVVSFLLIYFGFVKGVSRALVSVYTKT